MTHHRLLPLLCALCLLSPAFASAQDAANITTQPQDTEAAEKERFLNLVAGMCGILYQSQRDDYAEMPYEIENLILRYNGWSRDTPDYRQRVSEFWNEHNNDLTCSEDHRYIEQHFFVRVVDMRLYKPVLNKYFLNSNDEGTENLYSIDVNAYQIMKREIDGKIVERKETLLDFIDDVLADPKKARGYNTSEIRSLREVIIDYYGAKKGSELPAFRTADYRCGWDSVTALSNEKRHGISFEEAQSGFLDEDVVLLRIPNYFESDFNVVVIGRSNPAGHLLVIHGIAERNGQFKILSASPAGPEATAVYQAKGASTEIEIKHRRDLPDLANNEIKIEWESDDARLKLRKTRDDRFRTSYWVDIPNTIFLSAFLDESAIFIRTPPHLQLDYNYIVIGDSSGEDMPPMLFHAQLEGENTFRILKSTWVYDDPAYRLYESKKLGNESKQP